MKTIHGNLLHFARVGMFDAIIQGCNCQWDMGGGIAKQIADQFPLAKAADICFSKKGDESKLGSYTMTFIVGTKLNAPFIIINAYTQFQGGADVNYGAIRKAMHQINIDFKGMKIGFPAIGAGIAGGDWKLISEIIEEELKDVGAIYVEYVPQDQK